ncbi:agamous-like mads-box protein agl36 [Phtheirospermum japonicum]|uniref:Agamous-like mads-box protein agl36 n=1 Tax=Phtheirospermum japonicum TaxID=374723 RepID=A0A830C724_9LAMI|nr:agamous-like mads-box protein agl36 [Phtheirospermum japonicum]
MGRRRGNLKVEFIVDKKSRNATFKRRKEGLVKKIKELSTLCDVDACMIIYAPDHAAPDIVWPPNNPDQIHRMIHLYRAVQDFNVVETSDLHKRKAMTELGQFGVDLKNRKREKELQSMDCPLFINNDADTCSYSNQYQYHHVDHQQQDQSGPTTIDNLDCSMNQDSSMMTMMMMDDSNSVDVGFDGVDEGTSRKTDDDQYCDDDDLHKMLLYNFYEDDSAGELGIMGQLYTPPPPVMWSSTDDMFTPTTQFDVGGAVDDDISQYFNYF